MRPIKQKTPIAADRTIYLLAVDSADQTTLIGSTDMTGGTWHVYLSKNGAAGVLAGATPTEVDATNMKGLFSLVLATTEVDTIGSLVVFASNSGGTKSAAVQPIHLDVVEAFFATAATGTLSTTVFTSDRTEADNFWVSTLVHARTGSLAGQVKKVGAYVNAGGKFTLATGETFSAAPAAGDVFEILTR